MVENDQDLIQVSDVDGLGRSFLFGFINVTASSFQRDKASILENAKKYQLDTAGRKTAKELATSSGFVSRTNKHESLAAILVNQPWYLVAIFNILHRDKSQT